MWLLNNEIALTKSYIIIYFLFEVDQSRKHAQNRSKFYYI